MGRVDGMYLTLGGGEDDELLKAKLVPKKVASFKGRGRQRFGVATARESADEARGVAGQVLQRSKSAANHDLDLAAPASHVQFLDMSGYPGDESLLIKDRSSLLDLPLG